MVECDKRFGINITNSTPQNYDRVIRIKKICCQLDLKRGLKYERY